MKKVIVTVATVLLTGMLIAQDYTPPPSASTNFKAKYPQGVVDEWVDAEEEIICYFEDGDNFGSAYFSTKGVWLRSEFSIAESELPKPVYTSIMAKHKGCDIVDATKIDKPAASVFSIYIFNNDTEKDYLLTIDQNGKIIKEEDLNEDDSFE